MSRKRLSRGVVVVLILAACTACGGGGGGGSASSVSPHAWVTSVCNAVVPFRNDVQRRAGALSFAGATNISEVKHALEGFMSAAAADATQAASKIQSAGAPNVPGGKRDAAVLVGAFNGLASALSSAESQAKALPTNSPGSFKAGAQKLSGTIQSALTNISPSFNSLKDNPTLDCAAKSTSACAGLVGS